MIMRSWGTIRYDCDEHFTRLDVQMIDLTDSHNNGIWKRWNYVVYWEKKNTRN